MHHLADAAGRVAVLGQQLGQRREAGPLTEAGEEGEISKPMGSGRSAAGEDRGARRPAQGHVTVVTVEAQGAFGQPIDVGRARPGIPIAAEVGGRVVADDEQYVAARRWHAG